MECPARLFAALAVCVFCGAAEQNGSVNDAAALALQHGDFAKAELILRANAKPGDAWTLSLLGYALDNQKRAAEAEEFHQRAMALAPRSPEILNNYGTHLWLMGQYGQAEIIFGRALAAAPTYFNVLYNLGVMATYAGHYDRAREVLESALRQQPDNLDVLYRLASADELSKHWEDAALRLAHAARLDSKRADVQKLLAVTTTELGDLYDAAAAWDRYLALEPGDDPARRERAYTTAKLGKTDEGIAGIQAYLSRHPDDPVAHYELGQVERNDDPAKALPELDRAVSLDPNNAPARLARGSLYYQQGKPESALPDLEKAVSLDPANAAALDHLGQAYQALDRTADAVRALQKAVELAPGDSKTVLHLARALAEAGRTDESKAMMDRFRQLGPEKRDTLPAGLVDYLALAPAERRAAYRARVEKAVREHPEESSAHLEYLKLLLEDHNAGSIPAEVKRLTALNPEPAVLASAGRTLLEAGEYELARGVLQRAVTHGPAPAAAWPDLALATYHCPPPGGGAQAALALLDGVPANLRGSDYHLARAQMSDPAASSAAVDEALREAGGSPAIYVRGTVLLIQKRAAADAMRVIENAALRFPDSRDVLLIQATTLEFAGQTGEAARRLTTIENRWPEWPAGWAAGGIILAAHQRFTEARPQLKAAAALGSDNAAVRFFLTQTEEALAGRRNARPDRESEYLSELFQGNLLRAGASRGE